MIKHYRHLDHNFPVFYTLMLSELAWVSAELLRELLSGFCCNELYACQAAAKGLEGRLPELEAGEEVADKLVARKGFGAVSKWFNCDPGPGKRVSLRREKSV
jgi:hypothetical protein